MEDAPERIWRHWYRRTINPIVAYSDKENGLHGDIVIEYIRADIAEADKDMVEQLRVCRDHWKVSAEQFKADNQRLREDVDFLLQRSHSASCLSFVDEARNTGASSNSIVAIAYGSTVEQETPSDQSDLNACRRMWEKLPAHRKTKAASAAMAKAEQALNPGKDE